MKLADKVAIVTGGGRGIGAGISKRLAEEGAKVVIAQRDDESAGATIEQIMSKGGEALYIQTDVSEPETVQAMMTATVAKYGTLDILVNNAGIGGQMGHFLDLSLERWQRIIDVNLTGVFVCGQAAARLMLDAGGGRIINIGSTNSFVAEANASPYVAAKGGVMLLTRAMAVDLASHGILVNCIAPGSIRVERNTAYYDSEAFQTLFAKGVPLGHPGTPADIGAAVAFLASDDANFITGSTLVVDGGFTSFFRIE